MREHTVGGDAAAETPASIYCVDGTRIICQYKFCLDGANTASPGHMKASGDSYQIALSPTMTGLDRIGRPSLRQPGRGRYAAPG